MQETCSCATNTRGAHSPKGSLVPFYSVPFPHIQVLTTRKLEFTISVHTFEEEGVMPVFALTSKQEPRVIFMLALRVFWKTAHQFRIMLGQLLHPFPILSNIFAIPRDDFLHESCVVETLITLICMNQRTPEKYFFIQILV